MPCPLACKFPVMAGWQRSRSERRPGQACRSLPETFIVMTDDRLARAKALILESQRLRVSGSEPEGQARDLNQALLGHGLQARLVSQSWNAEVRAIHLPGPRWIDDGPAIP